MQKPQLNVPVLLFAGLTGMAAITTAWFGLETFLLTKKKNPITWYVRNAISWHPYKTAAVTTLTGLAVGAAVTHFVADDAK